MFSMGVGDLQRYTPQRSAHKLIEFFSQFKILNGMGVGDPDSDEEDAFAHLV